MENIIFLVAIAAILFLIFRNIVRIVPQNEAYIIERLGKYSSTFEAGLHLLIPFIDKVTYRHSLKEFAITYNSAPSITYNPAPSITYNPAPSITYNPAPSMTYNSAPSMTYNSAPSMTYNTASLNDL